MCNNNKNNITNSNDYYNDDAMNVKNKIYKKARSMLVDNQMLAYLLSKAEKILTEIALLSAQMSGLFLLDYFRPLGL